MVLFKLSKSTQKYEVQEIIKSRNKNANQYGLGCSSNGHSSMSKIELSASDGQVDDNNNIGDNLKCHWQY
jgi:hypothetical protein